MTISNTRTGYYGLNFGTNNNYVTNAEWLSPIYDTFSAGWSNQFANYIANQSVPAGSSIAWTFRSGNQSDLSDAGAYTSSISSLQNRYIQAKATIVKDDSGTSVPIVSDVSINSNSQGQSVMAEEGATNTILWSEDFTGSGWTATRASVLSNVAFAPDGTFTADKLVEDNTVNSTHVIARGGGTVGQPWSLSVYAKAAERNWIALNPGGASAYFNLTTGTIGNTITNGFATITPVGNGWYRCTCTVLSGNAGSATIFIAETDNDVSFTGDNISGVYLWGCQFENKSYPTSYIKTTGSGVGRNAEVISIPGSILPTTAGSFVGRAYFNKNGDPNTIQMLFDGNSTGVSGMTVAYDPTSDRFRFQYGNGAGSVNCQYNGALGSSFDKQWITVGCSWGPAGSNISVNGGSVSTVATVPVMTNGATSYIGCHVGSQRFWNGLIDDIVLYNEALTTSELQSYTASGAVIPTDHRTVYRLRNEGNLQHEEAGYRLSSSVDLTNIGTIAGSTITWNENESFVTGAVTLTQLNNVTVTGGNSVQKTSGTDAVWNAGSFSQEFLADGQNGFVQFTTDESNKAKMCGFASNNSGITFNGLYYAIYLNSAGVIQIYELGSLVYNGGLTYSANDILKAEIVNNVLKYYKNDVLFYTSSNLPTYPLFVKQLFYSSSGTLKNIIIGRYAKVDIDSSIDGGTTFSACTNGGTIPGLTGNVSSSGMNLVLRQKIQSPAAAQANASLNDVTVKVQQLQTGEAVVIKPVFNKLLMTPSNISKWQFEAKPYKTSYIAGTRSNEYITISNNIANSLILSPASGAVVARIYVDGELATSTAVFYHYIFYFGDNGSANLIGLRKSSGNAWNAIFFNATQSTTVTKSVTLSKGWHTLGTKWNASESSLWIDGIKEATSLSPKLPVVTPPLIAVGAAYNGTLGLDGQISQIDFFREDLTDTEMQLYTQATGAIIAADYKHSYQLKFENNLNYGVCGIYYSRWLDAGVNATGTSWISLDKIENKPAGTSTRYFFKASDSQDDSLPWVEDITMVQGRYIKIKAYLMSQDSTVTPTITYLEPIAATS